MLNRDEAEAHTAVVGTVEESAQWVWYSFVGKFGNVYVLFYESITLNKSPWRLKTRETVE
jgi:hypothetical protein